MARGGVKDLSKAELASKIFSLASKSGVRISTKAQFVETASQAFDKNTLVEVAKAMRTAVEKKTGQKQKWSR